MSDARDEGRPHPKKLGADAPELEPNEERKADEEEALNADITYEVVRRQGERELRRSASGLAWSGLAAGLSMGFSLVAEGLLRAHLPDADWRPLVTKLGYSVGFLVVILGSQQLFTENTLTPIVPLLSRRSPRVDLGAVARLWAIVLAANLAGALLFVWLMVHAGGFGERVHDAFAEIAREAMRRDFWGTAASGVFAGWLIALMVWMLPAAEAMKPVVIIIMTWLVGVGGFAHVVAGSVEVFYRIVTGEVSIGHAFGGFVLPTLMGNIVGGVTLVAAVNHAQVVAGGGEKRED